MTDPLDVNAGMSNSVSVGFNLMSPGLSETKICDSPSVESRNCVNPRMIGVAECRLHIESTSPSSGAAVRRGAKRGPIRNSGNFNGDSIVDGADFILWNSNKFTQSDGQLELIPPDRWLELKITPPRQQPSVLDDMPNTSANGDLHAGT